MWGKRQEAVRMAGSRFRASKRNGFMARFLLVSSFLIATSATPLLAQSSGDPCSGRQRNRPTLRVEAPETVPEIRIVDVRFDGTTKLALSEQNEIAAQIMSVVDEGRKGWLQCMQDRVRDAWQVRGYFRAEVHGESRELSSSPETKNVALAFHVDAGEQYRLSQIRFKNETQFSAVELRRLFPINDGDIFDVDKIGLGIEATRRAYGELGFINFTAVPDTSIDDQGHLVVLTVDLDEGKQLHIADVKVVGEKQKLIRPLLRQYGIVPGEVFDFRRVEELARELDLRAEDDIESRIDAEHAAVCLLIHLPQP